jgi:ketosteroid isomerase-like protein
MSERTDVPFDAPDGVARATRLERMKNSELTRRFVCAFNEADTDALLGFLHPDVELRTASLPTQLLLRGHEGFRRMRAELDRRLPRASFTPLGLLEADGTVIVPGRLCCERSRRGRNNTAPIEILGSVTLTMRKGRVIRLEIRFEPEALERVEGVPRSRHLAAVPDVAEPGTPHAPPVPPRRAAR